MPSPKPERELRRAVSQLSQYSIEDIEAIWSQLDPREQEQLRPMLAQASELLPGTQLPGLQPVPSPAQNDAIERVPAGMAVYLGRLPEAVAASVLSSFEPAARESLLAALPDKAAREPLRASAGNVALMPAARRALQAAAIAASHEVELSAIETPAPAAAPRRGLAGLLRRSPRA
ncbi:MULTISPECIES: hypothetical protein [unclassified Lysobacter]|uniref:hypothetical protein n=1 Tax=unclassified Lysobacter TaxID=2635362 RepID=UPI001BEAFFDF|nr:MULTISPECIES: hypothetical protein [unclassified Lysobacter]MBT2745984.1 hypothetical protein [Lysobacter sp. ISL-42]MBT2752632.1 hypothetical protein [Lysobacter sp. ISL-50]MBT2777371.1 hypothetical protein [Lysobacter sp. ISL-54]MBT2783562.1 hypothetical protein [Lysobacter sp. ISL-52]